MNTSKFDGAADRIGAKLKDLGKKFTIFTSVTATAFTAFGLKTAGDLEAARQGFVTLLGSVEDADKVIAQIKKDAAKTPFELKGLIEANQALTAVTKNGQRSERILLDVGKALAASGKGQAELDRMIANLQQIGLTGKITAMDIRQFGMAGINVLEILADYYGTTTDKAQKMVQESKNGFRDLEKAFAKAGGAGGKFEYAFKNQAGTFNQSLSNMKDSLTIFASDFVKRTGIFDYSKKAIQRFTLAIDENKEAIYSLVFSAKELGRKLVDLGDRVWTVLKPRLVGLWAVIKNDLAPALSKLYNDAIKPLIPIVGKTLVVALVAAIDALKIVLQILSPLINLLVKMKEVVLFATAAWVAFKAGIMISNLIYGVSAAITAMNASIVASSAAAGGARLAMSGWITTLIGPAGMVVALAAVGAAAVFQIGRAVKAFFDLRRETKAADAALRNLDRVAGNIIPSITDAVNKGTMTALQGQARMIQQYQSLGIPIAGLPKFASGGNPPTNRVSLVGEQGPELFIPKTSGTIIPHDKSMKMLGGETVNTSIYGDINIGSQVQADSFIARLTRNQELAQRTVTTRPGAMG